MTRTLRRFTLVLGSAALAFPVAAVAQPGAPARRPMPAAMGVQGGQGPEMDVTALLNARRQLDLTPRQVAQLDSIERSLFAERRLMETRMQAMGDSMRAARGAADRPMMNRDSAMARMETMRPQMEQMRRRDSTSRSAAQRVLNETQRQQVREMQAEERGRQRGMREARQGGRAGVGGARGGQRGGVRGGMPPGRAPAPDATRRPPDSGN